MASRSKALGIVLIASIVNIGTPLAAPSIKVLDLARDPGDKTESTLPGEYVIVIRNRLPDPTLYVEEFRLENIPIDVLKKLSEAEQAIWQTPTPEPSKARVVPPPAECNSVIAKLSELKQAGKNTSDKNAEVKFLMARLAWESEFSKPDCKDPDIRNSQLLEVDDLLRFTEAESDTFTLQSGQRLIVTVTRGQGDEKKGWEYTLATGSRGEWHTSLGIMLIPNKDENFFSKDNGDGAFTIAKKRSNNGIEPALGAFYTWLAKDDELSDWSHGPTAGLGFDKDNLLLFLGWNITYNQNIGANFGIVAHKQKRLTGEYKKNQILTESLTSESLTEEVYRANAFVGITFRF